MSQFYRLRKNRLFFGVVAGLADKFGWDLTMARIIIAIFMFFTRFGILLYVLLGVLLPYKEDEKKPFESNGGRRKDAEIIDGDD